MTAATANPSSLTAWREAFDGREADALQSQRAAAMRRFEELGFPTRNIEAWRHTPVTAIEKQKFEAPSELLVVRGASVEAFGATVLTFADGCFLPEGSKIENLPEGVTVGSLKSALSTDAKFIQEKLGQVAKFDDNAFTALNTALWEDGAVIHVPKGVKLSTPVHVAWLTLATETPARIHPRLLVVLEEGAEAVIVESFVAPMGGVYFNNPVTELIAGPNSRLEHYKYQAESLESFHVGAVQGYAERDSRITTYSISFGAALARTDVGLYLDGEGIEGIMNGLYVVSGTQHVDHHTRLDHAKPHCTSHELYKGILRDRAHGVFNGHIVVHQDAQKTDAKQSNRNLLLSDTATIDAMPQLEIYADDVKCTHGATIGQLNEESMFYLQSRGIDRAEARGLLTFAFANEVAEGIGVETLRKQVEARIFESLAMSREMGTSRR